MKYGLCCICLSLASMGIKQKRITFKTFSSLPRGEALEKLSKIWLNNARTAYSILEFCSHKKIARYRISSDIFPLATHPKAKITPEELDNFKEIIKILNESGSFAASKGIGLSFHPSQFVSLASPELQTRINSAAEINFNSIVLDFMGAPADARAPINIHLNVQPQKNPDMEKNFAHGLSLLSPNARMRLTIENEDKGFWNAARLLKFLAPHNIPLVLDIHHESLNSSGIPLKRLAALAAATWPEKSEPILHISSGRTDNPRAHADYCPPPPKVLDKNCVFMVEAKAKDFAIEKLMKYNPKLHEKL